MSVKCQNGTRPLENKNKTATIPSSIYRFTVLFSKLVSVGLSVATNLFRRPSIRLQPSPLPPKSTKTLPTLILHISGIW